MIQKLIEKLNKKRLKERISSAIVMVALIVSISGVVGAVSGIVVSNRYNYALKNYGFSQGDIGKMMITLPIREVICVLRSDIRMKTL